MSVKADSKSLIGYFARHKVAGTLLMILAFLFGAYSLVRLNVRFLPPLNLNTISVTVAWPGGSPQDVDNAITTPLERNVKTVDNLKHISSVSSLGLSYVLVTFKTGTDMQSALNQVRSKVSLVRNLPRTSLKPVVENLEVYERIARVLITSDDSLAALRPYVKKFEKSLMNKPTISRVSVDGLPKQVLSIGLTPMQIVSLRRSFSELGDQINSQSQDVSAGMVGLSSQGHQLRGVAKKRDIIGFGQLPIVTGDSGMLIHLLDMANVKMGLEDSPKLVYGRGKSGVSLTVFRAKNESALKSAQDLYAWKKEIEPQLASGMHVKIYEAYWQLIKDRINVLLKNGATGLILIFVLLYFLLDTRIAGWVALSIPISLSAALFMLYCLGGSINMVSMFAMIMSLGIIVDDTIVVAEQSVTEYQSGKSPLEAVAMGARRMLVPILASSLTTVAAFLPLLLLSGTFGEVLISIPRVVICVIFASLIECFLILPMHLKLSFSKKRKRKPWWLAIKIQSWFDRLGQVHFRRLSTLAVRRCGITLAIGLGSFIVMIGLLMGDHIKFTFFPTPPGMVVDLNLSFVSGTSTSAMVRQMSQIETEAWDLNRDLAAKGKGVLKTSAVFIHKGSLRTTTRDDQLKSSIVFDLMPPEDRTLTNKQFISLLRRSISLSPEVENMTLSAPRNGPPGTDLEIGLRGAKPLQLKKSAVDLKNYLLSLSGVSEVKDNLPYSQAEYLFHLRPEAQKIGLTMSQVGQQLRSAYTGHLIQLFYQGDDEVEVRIRLGDLARNSLGALDNMPIKTPQGEVIPLSSAVKITQQKTFSTLPHWDGDLTVDVTAAVDSSVNNTNAILSKMKKTILLNLKTQYGVHYFIKGRMQDQENTLKEMQYAVLLALALMFIVLCWVSSSYTWPLFVMLAIPFGLEGAVFGHWVMGVNLTLLSLFGFFGLTGIVVNDSIILLFRYKELFHQGMKRKDAIIEACCQRFRAVTMTSLTTIAGLSPLLLERSTQAQFLIPMAISICFGLLFSTFIILLMIPAAIAITTRKEKDVLLYTQ